MESKKTKKELLEEVEKLDSRYQEQYQTSYRLALDLQKANCELHYWRKMHDEAKDIANTIAKKKDEEKKALQARLETELEKKDIEIEELSYKPSFLDSVLSLTMSIAGIVALCALLFWQLDILRIASCVVIACLILGDWLPPTHRRMGRQKAKKE